MIQPWKKHTEKIDYDCGFFKVRIQESSSPVTGKKHPFYILSTHSWVNVIAVTPEKKVILVSQYRHGSQEVSLEIPGGAANPSDNSPEKAARRELLEETGYESDQWVLLGAIRPNPAILDNTCHIFLAVDACRVSELSLDEAEELEVSLHDLGEVPEMVRSGQIHHALVLAAFHLFDLFRGKNPGVV